MNRRRHGYYRVQEDLRKITESYFTYLTNDRSIPDKEREELLVRDIQAFFALARIYRDPTTTQYLTALLDKETSHLSQEQKPSATTPAPQRTNGSSRQQRPTARARNREERQDKKIDLPQNFTSLDAVVKALSIDAETLVHIAKNLGVTIETYQSGEIIIQGVTDQTYEKVKNYVRDLRS